MDNVSYIFAITPNYNLFYLCVQYRENNIDECDMGLFFAVDDQTLGKLKTHELIPGGRSKPVTEENKHYYAE